VIGRSLEEHKANLKEVFRRLKEANLRLSPEKCQFFKKELLYLGHRVTSEGIGTDPEKVEAIAELEPPSTEDAKRQESRRHGDTTNGRHLTEYHGRRQQKHHAEANGHHHNSNSQQTMFGGHQVQHKGLVKRHTSQTPRRPVESAAVMDTGRGDVGTNACCSAGCAGE